MGRQRLWGLLKPQGNGSSQVRLFLVSRPLPSISLVDVFLSVPVKGSVRGMSAVSHTSNTIQDEELWGLRAGIRGLF